MPENQPVLLSSERVAEIGSDAEVYPAGCQRAVNELLGDREAWLLKLMRAQQDLIDFRQQVANAFEWMLNTARASGDLCPEEICAAATRLGIDLPTLPST